MLNRFGDPLTRLPFSLGAGEPIAPKSEYDIRRVTQYRCRRCGMRRMERAQACVRICGSLLERVPAVASDSCGASPESRIPRIAAFSIMSFDTIQNIKFMASTAADVFHSRPAELLRSIIWLRCLSLTFLFKSSPICRA